MFFWMYSVAILTMCLKIKFIILSNSFDVSFLMESWTDGMPAEYLIDLFETYHGLSVIIQSVVVWVFISFFQVDFYKFVVQAELTYVKICIMHIIVNV